MTIWFPVIAAAVIALIAGLILAVASVVFAVPRDEKTEELKDLLPGANCGACGYSGCEGYARAMAHEGAQVGLCSPGGEEVARLTGEVLGVTASVVKKAAVIRCAGCESLTAKTADYRGIRSCKAVTAFYGGDKSCSYGCLGYGDCAAVCDKNAIRIENGMAVVDEALCVGCGLCAAACPRALIAVTANPTAAFVACANHDKGGVAKKLCKAACIGCMRCQKACEHGAVTVSQFLATVDPDKCVGCGKCKEVCPTGAMVQ